MQLRTTPTPITRETLESSMLGLSKTTRMDTENSTKPLGPVTTTQDMEISQTTSYSDSGQTLASMEKPWEKMSLDDSERNSIIAIAIEKAKKEKWHQMKREEYARRVNAEPEHLSWTLTQWLEFYYTRLWSVADHGLFKNLDDQYQADFHKVFRNLTMYFVGDESGPYNLRKGIRLYGPTGVGKTLLLRTFAENPTKPFIVKGAIELANEFKGKDGGEEFFIKYSNVMQHVGSNKFGVKSRLLCIDDLGVENPTIKRYGEEYNLFQDLIQQLYTNRVLFHVSDNLTSTHVQQRYGDRVESRFCEIFNEIDLSGFPDIRRL